ncbi:YgjP-like metallopeptidase domain-containing protein [Mycobacterium sp. NPDC049093]
MSSSECGVRSSGSAPEGLLSSLASGFFAASSTDLGTANGPIWPGACPAVAGFLSPGWSLSSASCLIVWSTNRTAPSRSSPSPSNLIASHYFERNHGERFTKLMDDTMPDWRTRRDLLNDAPLADEKWG